MGPPGIVLVLYADTSFLISLYLSDAHSTKALGLTASTKFPFVITPLTELEFTNSLKLSVFRKLLAAKQAESVLGHFAQDVSDGFLRPGPLPTVAFERAHQMATRHTQRIGTRTIDVLHVASALTLSAKRFYTFDRAQAKLARMVGLDVIGS